MSPEQIEKLEKLLGLIPATLTELDDLQKDPELMEDASIMQDFLTAVESHGNALLKKEMNRWEAEALDKPSGGQRAPSSYENVEDIPHAVLEQYFAPLPKYEVQITATMRDGGPALLLPQTGFDWNTAIQYLKFEPQLDKDIKYVIENNRSEAVQSGVLEAQSEVKVSFPFDKQLPGRYYLKVYNDAWVRLVAFFVRKDLLG